MTPQETTIYTTNQQAIALQRYEFDRAANLLDRVRWLSFFGSLGSLAALFVPGLMTIGTAAGLSFAALIFYMDRLARSARSLAEHVRRITIFEEAWGRQISADQWRDFCSKSRVSDEELKRGVDPKFFSETSVGGWPSLGSRLLESCFFTRHLMHSMSNQTLAWLLYPLFLLVLSVSMFFDFLPMHPGWTVLPIAKPFSIVVGTLISRELLGLRFDYATAARDLELLEHRLRSAKLRGFPESEMIHLLRDYDVCVASAPPIPNRIYRVNAERLNKLWAKSNR